jgi:hypothetical protein
VAQFIMISQDEKHHLQILHGTEGNEGSFDIFVTWNRQEHFMIMQLANHRLIWEASEVYTREDMFLAINAGLEAYFAQM